MTEGNQKDLLSSQINIYMAVLEHDVLVIILKQIWSFFFILSDEYIEQIT